MTLKEKVVQEITCLDENALEQIAQYVAFLKFKARMNTGPHVDEVQIKALYAESFSEDRMLAEEGMEEYGRGLTKEDSQ